ncbi:MAG TPA: bifunctional 3'-5' exonuclease/DNA polymerase, partial [Microbacterium sp.]|nr:bifunctional 3'-5' exonuclease/DNA polymerase [Microbacterium sp.]
MSDAPGWIVLGRTERGAAVILLDANADEFGREEVDGGALTSWISDAEARWAPRWVWHDTPQWYAALLADGIRVARCHDLRLCHA